MKIKLKKIPIPKSFKSHESENTIGIENTQSKESIKLETSANGEWFLVINGHIFYLEEIVSALKTTISVNRNFNLSEKERRARNIAIIVFSVLITTIVNVTCCVI